MAQIDKERVKANTLLEKSRKAWLPVYGRFVRAQYERQIEIVGRMLTQYHKEHDMDSNRKQELRLLDDTSRAKAQMNAENTFTLRAQDARAPAVIGEWIKQNIETAPAEKLHQALDIALAMREHQGRKMAD